MQRQLTPALWLMPEALLQTALLCARSARARTHGWTPSGKGALTFAQQGLVCLAAAPLAGALPSTLLVFVSGDIRFEYTWILIVHVDWVCAT